jgi:hypothetical protein
MWSIKTPSGETISYPRFDALSNVKEAYAYAYAELQAAKQSCPSSVDEYQAAFNTANSIYTQDFYTHDTFPDSDPIKVETIKSAIQKARARCSMEKSMVQAAEGVTEGSVHEQAPTITAEDLTIGPPEPPAAAGFPWWIALLGGGALLYFLYYKKKR